MKARLYLDFIALFAFCLCIGFVIDTDCNAYAEKQPRTLAERLEAILDSTRIAPPPAGRPETDEELHERLHEIAEDAAEVAKGSPSDAALILAVAQHESDFAADVDRGPCRPNTCDGGHASCLLQIHASPERRDELFANRRECFRVGLEALHRSMRACRSAPFASYASGSCISNGGVKSSAELEAYWRKWQDRLAAEVAKDKASR